MHRFLAILLLVLLPFQSSWAAVASYCAHEEQVGAKHFGHHEHQHHADTGSNAEAVAHLDVSAGGKGGKAPGATDLDCSHCHGFCSVMPTPSPGLPVALSTAPPSADLDEGGGAHAPTRPERPQWRPLA